MPFFNIERDITKKEVRDLVLGTLSSDDDKFYPSIDAYFQQTDNPREKLTKLECFEEYWMGSEGDKGFDCKKNSRWQ